MLVQGIFEGTLPWGLLLIGAAIGLVVELLGVPSLPFAIGVYLPVHLTVPIFLGGIARYFVEKRSDGNIENGTLYASGLVAGDALIGILAAFLTTTGVSSVLRIGDGLLGGTANFVALGMTLLVVYTLYTHSIDSHKSKA